MSRYERGAARIRELDGEDPSRRHEAYAALARIAPDLPRFAVEFAYGDIHSRPGLDPARRELVILGVLVGLGDTRQQLASHLRSALNVGLTRDELVEAVLQTLPYAGFPRAINAMEVLSGIGPPAQVTSAAQPPHRERTATPG
ncbi:carboxymuconolactone decarboxylase family protein [Dactylosporangium sp. NPDC049140]|uniref:carboxymuconolactone decarboxylase family protein n=1 Tax=Dactylosporangium sp. NPDC049140 TaxID=3155647 RepID=UPI0033F1A483